MRLQSLVLFAGLVGLSLAQSRSSNKKVVVENGAICENKASAFFVIDNTMLVAGENVLYKEFSEEECMNTCSNNRDPFGRSILCASFVYDHVSFTCTIYKQKGKPEGKGESTNAVGKRYFEKFCLSEDLPITCADAQFIRADDSVLVGYANNVTITETLEECVATCVRDTKCKSAMFFYEEGECITNTESALSRPTSFAKEDTEKVIYFQNGCLAKQAAHKAAKKFKTTSAAPPTTAAPESTEYEDEEGSGEDYDGKSTEKIVEGGEKEADKTETQSSKSSKTEEKAPEHTASSLATEKSFESTEEEKEENTEETTEPTTASEETKATEDTEDESTEATTAAPEATTAAEVLSSEAEGEYETESTTSEGETEDDFETEDMSTTTAATPKRKIGEKTQYIKYQKHPKNFGSKTLKAFKDEQKKKPRVEPTPEEEEFQPVTVSAASQQEEEGTDEENAGSEEEMRKEEDDFLGLGEEEELPQGSDGSSKKHNLAIKPLKLKEEQIAAQNYFSEWSDWTPCTHSGERRIRRRKCLDLRKCLGALMQVENCPAMTTTPIPDDYDLPALESVKSIVAEPTDVDTLANQGARPVQLPTASSPSTQTTTESLVWSPWLGVCQQFASGQPCNSGEMIGFESRECIAKDPSQCNGPFFRYCTLQC